MYFSEKNPKHFNNNQEHVMELYSSAYTLSDMEIFVFPELLFSLVLAEIMSDRLWAWRDDSWFNDIQSMPVNKRVSRIKQYIMDHYSFNLDLDTWGLTSKEEEIMRFSSIVDIAELKKSNALFGYEGDRYYFSIDIRRHFGLDKYDSNLIPYWKTETLEAMDAFTYKDDWNTGGGECVSLSVLYAAALFVVGRIPLEDIFLMATPLHSQNFVFAGEGLLTNNRRIVTKNMFFNGTELSMKARRALENEKVTLVANRGQYIHFLYDDATLDDMQYERFMKGIESFLRTDFTPETFGNFVRSNPEFSHCFSYRHIRHGKEYYIECEKALRYEASTKLKVSDRSRKKMLSMIDQDEFYPDKIPGRLVVNDLESFIRENNLNFDLEDDRVKIRNMFCGDCEDTCDIVKSLRGFIHVEPRLPDSAGKKKIATEPIDFEITATREEIINQLQSIRDKSLTADLAFHAHRLPGGHWAPFWKAALERSPVSIAALEGCSLEQILEKITALLEQSIYPGDRLAQPDEVWNFQRGDGFEKGVLLLNVLNARFPEETFVFEKSAERVVVKRGTEEYIFTTQKKIEDFVYSV